jgi:hypothetical protein
MSGTTTVGLDKRLRQIFSNEDFLAMKGLAKEVPIFIQTYDPAEEDQIRVIIQGLVPWLTQRGKVVKHVDLLELVLQLLEARPKGNGTYLDRVIADEASWTKEALLKTLKSVADPTRNLVPKLLETIGSDSQLTLITGSGRVYPFLRTHTIIEALPLDEGLRHPMVIFFPGDYSQESDGGSYLRLFGTVPTTKIENPHYRATNLSYFNPTSP